MLCKKTKKEIITTEEAISTSGIPLQLTKLRDAKHASSEKVENILDMQMENKVSPHKFDIKKADDLFDDLPLDELCLEAHSSKSTRMDIFAEYESEESRSKQRTISSEASSVSMHAKEDETNEGKMATLKLIPKQLLIRRTNEQVKPKRVLDIPLQDPVQHAAALLTIQKKLLESHALKEDVKELNEEPADQFVSRHSTTNISDTLVTDKLLDRTEFDVAPKSSITAARSRSPASEKLVSVRSTEQPEDRDKVSKSDDVKKYKMSGRSDTSGHSSVRSPIREQRKRSSPNRKESERRYSHDYGKDKKERKSEDAEKADRRDSRSAKVDLAENSRRRTSPPGRGRRKRSRSPYVPWERQGSGSGSPGHSWSRSRSKSPRRKDESAASTSARDREKKQRDRYNDERPGRSRTDEKRERYARSPPRSSYNEGKERTTIQRLQVE